MPNFSATLVPSVTVILRRIAAKFPKPPGLSKTCYATTLKTKVPLAGAKLLGGYIQSRRRVFPLAACAIEEGSCRFVAKFGEVSAKHWEIRAALILLDNAPIPPCDGPTAPDPK